MIARLMRRTPLERRIALEAAVLVPAARLGLALLPFHAVQQVLDRLVGVLRGVPAKAPGTTDRKSVV